MPGDPQVAPGPGDASGPLAHIPLFARLDAAEQRALVATMKLHKSAANEVICWQGDPGDSLYVINSGNAVVTASNEKGEHMLLKILAPGEFFGEISLLDAGPRTATVRAAEACELFVLGRDDFHQFLRDRPDAAIHILAVMGERQRAATQTLRSVRNPNAIFDAARASGWQRISDLVATIAASQWFTLFHMCWFGVWITFNLLGTLDVIPRRLAWDPFPFGLLTMIVSLEAIFLSIFVLVSQNRQTEKDRLRTDLDYQINVRAQSQITDIERQLDRIEHEVQTLRAASSAGAPKSGPGQR